MNISLIGAELEENLGLRYIGSILEEKGHIIDIIPFNSEFDIQDTVQQVMDFSPQITCLSMVFTSRAREFCDLAQSLRDEGYKGHINAGGHFAALNSKSLLKDFAAFDSVALGEGENIISALANNPDKIARIPGLCYRQNDGSVKINLSTGNQDDLDALPFPKRITFHEYFNNPIASILSTRGCWRKCSFCSINAWYKSGGGKKFRVRSVENLITEMKELYFKYGIRIFNFQDDNFFLPDKKDTLNRFEALRDGLQKEGVKGIAIAVKARPDSITYDSISILDELGLFRVFLGVENASENGLNNLNRKCSIDKILNSLRVLNDFDIHVAYNLLMFEPDTVMDDILTNLRFMERHIDNPFNFCRAEVYAGTGLEAKLRAEGRLLGDYFGFDYRLKDPHSEVFHQIANYAFFDRNFSDSGLHYFNMQVDFCFQLLRRFYPEVLTQTLRGDARNFIKQTNLDTYKYLNRIYDFVVAIDTDNQLAIRGFAREIRKRIDESSLELRALGENILDRQNEAFKQKDSKLSKPIPTLKEMPFFNCRLIPYTGLSSIKELDFVTPVNGLVENAEMFSTGHMSVSYHTFKEQLIQQQEKEILD